MPDHHRTAHKIFGEIWDAFGGQAEWCGRIEFEGKGAVSSGLPITDFAAAVIGVAGTAAAELVATTGSAPAHVNVDRILSSGWFHLPDPSKLLTKQPHHAVDWTWLSEFETRDGRFLRVQAAFPTLRKRVIAALGVGEDVDQVAAAVREQDGDAVEALLVEAGAAAAVNRTVEEWLAHPAGAAVHAEPMVHFDYADALVQSSWAPTPGRPLAGIRVLDMTRVIAGPTGTRFLAALGAEVLRLDEPGSDESSGQMGQGNEFMVGKRWALLDIRTPEGKQRFLDLLARTDILIHGYRPGGIDALVSQAERFQAKPDLIEVAYRAYGWTGPWAMRRGFDTIVQWSTGICNANQAWGLERPDRRLPLTAIGRKLDASRPRHMPVEALDFGTAYQIAAAALRGLTRRVQTGRGSVSRLSLARTASILLNQERAPDAAEIELPLEGPWEDRVYVGAKGPAKRLQFPVTIQGNPLFWERPTEPAGASSPVWAS